GHSQFSRTQLAAGCELGSYPHSPLPARWHLLTGDQVAHPYLHVLGRSSGRGKTPGILPAQDVVLGKKEADRAADLGHPEHLAELAVQNLHGLTQQGLGDGGGDRKSTRLNSSHVSISYAVF